MNDENVTNGSGDKESKKAEAPKKDVPVQDHPAQAAPGYAPGWVPPQPHMPPPTYGPPQGYYPPPPVYYPPPPPSTMRRKPATSNKPTVVGALLIIVGVLGIAMVIMGFAAAAFFGGFSEWFPGEEGSVITVSGQVTSLNGSAIEGASVSVVGQSVGAVTDADGNYILYSVPIGDQTIRVAKDGYVTVNHRMTLVADPFNFDSSSSHDEQNLDLVLSQGTGEVTTGNWFDEDIFNFGGILVTCLAIILVASILALLGAIFAFKREKLMFVVIGCVAGIFTLGFGIGTVLAFIALFVLLLSIDEFNGRKAGESQKA